MASFERFWNDVPASFVVFLCFAAIFAAIGGWREWVGWKKNCEDAPIPKKELIFGILRTLGAFFGLIIAFLQIFFLFGKKSDWFEYVLLFPVVLAFLPVYWKKENLGTFFSALGISAFGAFGFVSLVGVALSSWGNNPVAHPFYLFCGFFALVACLTFVFVYFLWRMKRPSFNGFLWDLSLVGAGFPLFFLLWAGVLNSLERL